MIFYGSEFFIFNNEDIREENISITIDNIIAEYEESYFASGGDKLATVDARWCVFYNEENKPSYFYCFTFVQFHDEKQFNYFKLKCPKFYSELRTSGLAITISDIESKLHAKLA